MEVLPVGQHQLSQAVDALKVLAPHPPHARARTPPAAQPAPVATAPAAAPDMAEKLQHLQQLGQLKDAGVLTDAEFEEQKTRILAS